ncbi:hypothetical protein GGI24_006576, partial [Coemansia furcata]
MIIIGDLNSRLGALSGDHSENPRGNVLEAHIRATNLEVINTRLPEPQMTFVNHNGSSVVDLVLAEPAAGVTILDFWVVKTNCTEEERDRTCLRSDHNAIECRISLPRTEGIVAKPRLRTPLLDTDDTARNEYHRLLGEGFKEWAEEAKRLLALNPNTTTFEEATAALESLNNDFCSIVRDALEQSVGRYRPLRPRKPPWWSHSLKVLKNRAVLEHHYYWSIAFRGSDSDCLIVVAHENAAEALKDFNTAYQQAALAWWKRKQLLLTAGSVNAMMRSISRSIRAKQTSASPISIQHEDKRAIDVVREHFGMVLNHSASPINIVDQEYRSHLRKDQMNPFTADAVRHALKCCGSNKAAGPDELQVEALKASPV